MPAAVALLQSGTQTEATQPEPPCVLEAPKKLHDTAKLRATGAHLATELDVTRNDLRWRADKGQDRLVGHGAPVLNLPQVRGIDGDTRTVAATEGELPKALVEDRDGPHAAARVQPQISEARARRDQALDVSPGVGDPYQRQRLDGREAEPVARR